MIRGFITIATGDKHYCKLAANLLMSYRFFSENPLPFAIIAEEENEYTALFDDVIITNESTRSFLDKFLLLKLCPYDETIFIDADSLVYGDLNAYWSFFENATDFSSLGENFGKDENGNAWYDVDGIGEYADKIEYKTRVHLGVCFIRNSDKVRKMYDDCMEIQSNLSKLHFHTCPLSVDECVIGLAMPMNNMLAIPEKVDLMAAYPCLVKLKADMLKKQLAYKTLWGTSTDEGVLLHWGTSQTFTPLYRFNAECLKYMIKKKENSHISVIDKIKYELGLRYLVLNVCYFPKIVGKQCGRFKNLIRKISERK